MDREWFLYYNEGRNKEREEADMEKLLEVQNLMKFYGNKSSLTKAVNDLSFIVEKENLLPLWEPAVPEKPLF